MMSRDMTFCSALFCNLAVDCHRKDHIWKPYDEHLSMFDFSVDSLYVDDMQELVCDDQLIK